MTPDHYRPPERPTPAQQRDALQKGLGRVYQWAAAGRLRRSLLLGACVSDRRFDGQIEADRGDWLWGLMGVTGTRERFRDALLARLRAGVDWKLEQQLRTFARRYGEAVDDAGEAPEPQSEAVGPAAPDDPPPRRASADRSLGELIAAVEGRDRCLWADGWGRRASDADFRAVLQRLWPERRSERLAKWLRVLCGRPLPEFDPRLIDVCRRASRDVRPVAFEALSQNSDPRVRAFALAQLAAGDALAIGVLVRNFAPGDEGRILESIRIPTRPFARHGVLCDVQELLAENPESDASRLGVLGFATTPCGMCREKFAEHLFDRGVAPDWLRAECAHDVQPGTRALARA